jgi:hypothetical protein
LLKKAGQTFGAGMQTQLNFAADGTVSTWVYNPQLAREEIIKYIVSEDLPIMMGDSAVSTWVYNPQSDSSLTAHLWKRSKGKESANSTVNQRWNPNAELNHYLSTNFAATDRTLKGDKVKLLEWWREHKYSFPVLSHFARDIILVPVSTVSSEATFSTVGRIIEERRSSLSPETVEAITCLKDWKRA